MAQARRGGETNNNQYWAEDNILLFLNFHKQRVLRKELAAGTLGTFYWAIKTFCDAYKRDLPSIDWKRLSKALPKAKSWSNDRAPTIEEIRKLVEYTDRRIKPLVLVMCSSGIRLGAWQYLRWKHVTPIKNDKGEVIAAKPIAYPDESEEYYTFITPEAYNALKEWMDYRAFHGETIDEESWLIRNMWRTVDVKRGDKCGRVGLATRPKKLSYEGVKKILNRALWDQGLRHDLLEGEKRRHEWKQAHGFRKFFKTRAEEVMNYSNVELLMGHRSGLQGSYYKPLERDVLTDYLRAVDALTINDHNKLTFQKLAEKEEQNDKEAEDTKKEVKELRGLVYAMQETIKSFQKDGVLNPVTFLVNNDDDKGSLVAVPQECVSSLL